MLCYIFYWWYFISWSGFTYIWGVEMNLIETCNYIYNMPDEVFGVCIAFFFGGLICSAFMNLFHYLFSFLDRKFDRWLDKKFPVDKEDKK